MKKPENILIIRTDRIGDVILTIPMAKVIKENFRGCKVSFLVRQYTAPLLEGCEYVDEIIILEEEADFISRNVKNIKAKNFDVCFIVSPSLKISLLPLLAGIPERVGTGYRWYSFLFNKKVFEHRKYGLKNELEYNLGQLSFWLGEKTVAKSASSFGMKVSEKALKKVKELLTSEKIDLMKPIIIIHPGSGGSAVDWPAKRFIELAALIKNEINAGLIITGSESEKELCQNIANAGSALNLAGRFNLAELAALISLSGIFIANSTGPLHIAAALGVNVIGFYPKFAAASPKRWGPYSEKAFIFQPEIECNNCTRKQCEQLNCMDSIRTENVFLTIGKIYKLLVKNGENNV